MLGSVLPRKSLPLFRPLISFTANMAIDIGGLKHSYRSKDDCFTEDKLVALEPIGQFRAWFEDAKIIKDVFEINAACLATCTKDGYPSARMVLVKDVKKDGFRFFTNYDSRKGRELMENPRAALVFYWDPLKRSVRVEGRVEKLSDEESSEYYHSRPRDSQIGAHVSKQSSVIPCREMLMQKNDELSRSLTNTHKEIPKPQNWGGYRIIPEFVEFWQGQTNRLHDRIRFRRQCPGENIDNVMIKEGVEGWVYERLSP